MALKKFKRIVTLKLMLLSSTHKRHCLNINLYLLWRSPLLWPRAPSFHEAWWSTTAPLRIWSHRSFRSDDKPPSFQTAVGSLRSTSWWKEHVIILVCEGAAAQSQQWPPGQQLCLCSSVSLTPQMKPLFAFWLLSRHRREEECLSSCL